MANVQKKKIVACWIYGTELTLLDELHLSHQMRWLVKCVCLPLPLFTWIVESIGYLQSICWEFAFISLAVHTWICFINVELKPWEYSEKLQPFRRCHLTEFKPHQHDAFWNTWRFGHGALNFLNKIYYIHYSLSRQTQAIHLYVENNNNLYQNRMDKEWNNRANGHIHIKYLYIF